MKGNKKILFYGERAESLSLEEKLKMLPSFADRQHEFRHTDSWDGLESELVSWDPDLVIIIADGAAGMEGVYLSRAKKPELPVCWFSDDYDFGMQSHRLDCVYFSTKPVTQDKLQKAIKRYKQMWC